MSRNFIARESPFLLWGSFFATPMMVPRLLGHRNVHIICWSDAYLHHIPVLMKALAGQSDVPTLGSPRACLERMRVTIFDPHRLVSRRSDLESMKTWGVVSQFFSVEAAKLGVEFEFRVLYPEANNVSVFEQVQPRADEVVAVTSLFVMLRSSEEPLVGGGTRVHLMQVRGVRAGERSGTHVSCIWCPAHGIQVHSQPSVIVALCRAATSEPVPAGALPSHVAQE